MPVSRFIAVKLKDEYSGEDEESKKVRENFFQKHVTLYKSRPYVLDVQATLGGDQSMGQGYHYGILVVFESEERLAYYSDVDPDHLDFKSEGKLFVQGIFAWGFPRRD